MEKASDISRAHKVAEEVDKKKILEGNKTSEAILKRVWAIGDEEDKTESKSGFNKIPTWSKMYGLNIAQRGGVSQIYPPYCALPYRANGQNCPLLKNE